MIYSSVWDETNPFTYKNPGVCPVKDLKLGSLCVACTWSTTLAASSGWSRAGDRVTGG
jgi:hypothetical protein